MVKPRLQEHLDRLHKYINETGKKVYDLAELAALLGVSWNYAREIVKIYTRKYGGRYAAGFLYIGENEG